jgi:CheY-like chemotaxis protein
MHASSPALSGRRLLIVEDELLVAMDNAAELEAAGAIVVGTAGNIKEALRMVETAALDGALLDANLNGESVDHIAAALAHRNVPFIFVSGYGRENLPPAFASTPILGKPFSRDELVNATVAMFERAAPTDRLRST